MGFRSRATLAGMSNPRTWAVMPLDAVSSVVLPTAPPEPVREQPFRLRPELYPKNRAKLILRLSLVYGGSCAAGLLIGAMGRPVTRAALMMLLTTFLPLFIAGSAFFIWRKVLALHRRYHSFLLWIDDHGLRREQALTPVLEVKKEEITECLGIPGKGTLIRTASARRIVWIGDELDGYDIVLDTLRRWDKLRIQSKLPLIFRPGVSFAVSMLAVAGLFLLRDPILLTVVGAAFLAFAGWQVYILVFGTAADSQAKRQLWSAAFMAIVVMVRILFAWR